MKNFNPSFKLGVFALVITALVVLAPETSASFMDTVKGWFTKEKTEGVKVEDSQEKLGDVATSEEQPKAEEIVEEAPVVDSDKSHESEYSEDEDNHVEESQNAEEIEDDEGHVEESLDDADDVAHGDVDHDEENQDDEENAA